MRRFLAVALAVLLVTAAPIVAFADSARAPETVDASGPATDSAEDDPAAAAEQPGDDATPWVVVSPNAALTGAHAPGADLGAVLRMGDERIQSKLTAEAIARRYAEASTTDERQQVLDDALDTVGDDIEALFERERSVAARYADGEINQATLLRELAAITRAAATLEETVDRIDRLADRDSGVSVSTRSVNGELNRFDTPIRSTVVAAIGGETERAAQIRATAQDETLVVEQLRDRRYHREAMQYDALVHDGEVRFDSGKEVWDAANDLYPGISANHNWYISWYDSIPLADTTYSLSDGNVTYSNNEVKAYIDSTSTELFHEYHDVELAALETTETVTRSGENVTVQAQRVHDGGPIRLSVTDAETDEPLDATVSIAGEAVATTGADGERWLLAPAGDVPVTVSVDGENVVVTVRESV